jgi:hypothetical protein
LNEVSLDRTYFINQTYNNPIHRFPHQVREWQMFFNQLQEWQLVRLYRTKFKKNSFSSIWFLLSSEFRILISLSLPLFHNLFIYNF